MPGFSPRPLAWGTFASQPDSHFYVCDFYEFVAGALPEPTSFCKSLARLHQAPQNSTDRKFGFHCTTYNGDLPQDNTWFGKWEDFFANSLRHVLRVREERAGPNDELDSLLPTLFEKVIPRLLRPLETGGRTVAPSLVHGDLWCGNAAVVEETDESIVFDPAAFWGHNECKRFQIIHLLCESINEVLVQQMSSGIGDRHETNSQRGTFGSINRISPSRNRKKTLTTVIFSIQC